MKEHERGRQILQKVKFHVICKAHQLNKYFHAIPHPIRTNTNSDVLYLSKHACQTLLYYHVPQINATALPLLQS